MAKLEFISLTLEKREERKEKREEWWAGHPLPFRYALKPKSLPCVKVGAKHSEGLFYQSGAGVPPFTLISLTERSDLQGSAVGRFLFFISYFANAVSRQIRIYLLSGGWYPPLLVPYALCLKKRVFPPTTIHFSLFSIHCVKVSFTLTVPCTHLPCVHIH